MATKSKKSTKKVEYKQQEREVIAFCWVAHGTFTWSIGYEPNIIHATRAVRKAKRDNSLLGWQIMTVHIFDIHDSERWAWDGYQLRDPDVIDKESDSYKNDYYNQYKGCKPFKLIESLQVVT